MAMMGLDIGTSGCKSTILNDNFEICAGSYLEYPAVRSGGSHVLDANLVWQNVKQVMAESLRQSGGQRIEAISISSFGEAFVLVDEHSNVLDYSMLYTDNRGKLECEELTRALGEEAIINVTGINPHQMYSINKLCWIKKNQPEIFGKAYKAFQFEDFIIHMLTGECAVDYSLASRTMAFDIRKKVWWQDMFAAAGIDSSIFGKPVPAGTIVGEVKTALAEELGLPRGVKVVMGAQDQVCAAVGSGVLSVGMAVDGSGTVECITPLFDAPITNKTVQQKGYVCVPYAIEDMYATYAFTFTGGLLLKWYRDNLARYERQLAEAEGKGIYQYLDAQVPHDPSGLLVIPHFAGAATPYMDDTARGAILGMTLETTSIDIYHALMEGVAFEMRTNMETLREQGVRFDVLRATGGGANSRVWLQMKADILGLPITALKNGEAGTVGACMIASVALGKHRDLEDAARDYIRLGRVYEPDPARAARYDALYEKYQRMYAGLKDILR